MMMRDKLSSELKAAMKGGQKRRVETIRMINAAVKDREIEARPSGQQVGDLEIISLMQKMVKSRQESQEIYAKAGRHDLSTQEGEEIAIISEFLPEAMSDEDMSNAVKSTIAASGAATMKDMGKVVAMLKAEHAGRMDFAKASTIVKSYLSK